MAAITPKSASSDQSFSRSPTSSSTDTLSLPSIPSNIYFPRPIFIGTTAAVLIVTTDHEIRLEQHGIEPSGKSVQISPSALNLVNEFLDQLLFDILSKSKSLSMATLRIAIGEILKPKLARSAVQCADQDLQEYLDDGEGREDSTTPLGPDLDKSDWLVELWRKARLRCMACSSLRDIEEKDTIMDSENTRLMPSTIAIFLASILEFMGEQSLIVAGTAAHHRLQSKQHFGVDDKTMKFCSVQENLIVEVDDMESIALDRTLGRLWRGWRLRVESPTTHTSNDLSGSAHFKQPLPSENQTVDAILYDYTAVKERSAFSESRLAYLDLSVKYSATLKTHPMRKVCNPEPDSSEPDSIENRKNVILDDNLPNTAITSLPKFGKIRKRVHSIPRSSRLSYSGIDQWPQTMFIREENKSHDEKSILNTDQTGLPGKLGSKVNSTPAEYSVTVCPDSMRTETTSTIALEQHCGSEALTAISPKILEPAALSLDPFSFDESLTDITAKGMTSCQTSFDSHTNSRILLQAERFNALCGADSVLLQSEPTVCRKFISQLPSNPRPVSLNYPVEELPVKSRPALKTHRTWPASSASRQINYVTPVMFQSDDNTRKQKIESVVATEKELKLTNVEDSASEDGRISPSAIAFAEAVQGIDTYFFDPSFVKSNTNKDKKAYPVVVHQTKLYTSSSAVEDMARSSSVDEIEENISPTSLPVDEPFVTSRGSPTSTISTIEEVLDQETQTATRKSPMHSTQRSRDGSPEKSSQDHEFKRAIHTSGSASSSISHRLVVIRTSEEGAMENFDQLIESDQTIQYTLTPQNVCIVNNSEPFHIPAETDDETRPAANTSISFPATKCNPTKSTSPKGSLDGVMSARLFTPILQPDFGIGIRPRLDSPQSHDPQNTQESSMNDLTKFVRNIGSTSPASTNQASSFRSVKNSLLHATPSLYKKTPARTKLQSREAVAQRDESISDLIDFVRSGPQLENGHHRIPIAVAPFNCILDEDEILETVNGGKYDASLPEPRYYQTSPSVNSSVTSQSALLVSSSKSKQYTLRSGRKSEDNSKLTKRNLIDPLETSDNEDYEPSKLNLSREESLAEFLKNSAPSDQVTDSLLDKSDQNKSATKNAHSSALLSIFGRGSASTQSLSKITHKAVPNDLSSDSTTANLLDSNQDPQSSRLPQIKSTHTRGQQKIYEPREAISNFRTRELAEFLMSHDPPPTVNEPKPFYSTSKKVESSSLQKMFGRKKASISPKS